MAPRSTQISAHLSRGTRDLLDRYASAHGFKKAFLVEQALLHHLQALQDLPVSAIVPPRIVVTGESARRIAAAIRRPAPPTAAMRELMKRGRDSGGA